MSPCALSDLHVEHDACQRKALPNEPSRFSSGANTIISLPEGTLTGLVMRKELSLCSVRRSDSSACAFDDMTHAILLYWLKLSSECIIKKGTSSRILHKINRLYYTLSRVQSRASYCRRMNHLKIRDVFCFMSQVHWFSQNSTYPRRCCLFQL